MIYILRIYKSLHYLEGQDSCHNSEESEKWDTAYIDQSRVKGYTDNVLKGYLPLAIMQRRILVSSAEDCNTKPRRCSTSEDVHT